MPQESDTSTPTKIKKVLMTVCFCPVCEQAKAFIFIHIIFLFIKIYEIFYFKITITLHEINKIKLST